MTSDERKAEELLKLRAMLEKLIRLARGARL